MSAFTKFFQNAIRQSTKKPAPKADKKALPAPAKPKPSAAAAPKPAAKAVAVAKPAAKAVAAKKPAVAKPAAAKPSPALVERKTERRGFIEGKLALLNALLGDGEYLALRNAWNHAYSEDLDNTEAIQFLNILAEAHFSEANHEEVFVTARRMVEQHNNPLGYFYSARSHQVLGQYNKALNDLTNLLHAKPYHADGIYLLREVCGMLGQEELAWQALERLAAVSKRNKTWHVMATLVQTETDLFRLLWNWEKWKKDGIGPAYNKDVSEFIALAAMRVNNYELATTIWRDSLTSASQRKGGFETLAARKPNYSSRRAERALSDTRKVFDEADIEMFLVSGTLLGCVREGRLLGHDKDIDVGIWSSVPEEQVMQVVQQCGKFVVLSSRSDEIIRLRHVNGIAIDLFYHYREPDDYWHGGVKMIWHNTPFKLARREFLGEKYLIPKDYDLYLTENYGDWRTPKIDFDSGFDTPNGESRHGGEMAIHTYKGLLDACIGGSWDKAAFYLAKLNAYGEKGFAENFRRQLASMEIQLPEYVDPGVQEVVAKPREADAVTEAVADDAVPSAEEAVESSEPKPVEIPSAAAS
ncbi:MAG: tetratricopeptide repeat protein [Rhizobiaceae bacterium]|nr:tetratricopeptide repeat protein [Rhizobiaceae bacterium]